MIAITEKLNRSWQLFKRSVLVIRDHPKLLVFPIVTGLLTTAIALFFLAPVALVLLAPHWVAGSGVQTLADKIGFLRFQHGMTLNRSLRRFDDNHGLEDEEVCRVTS